MACCRFRIDARSRPFPQEFSLVNPNDHRQGDAMDGQSAECRRTGFVSVWIGTFPSLEAAEAYFGIPDEVGVFLAPEAFARDLGVDEQLLENLEADFRQMSPRPLGELLNDATFSGAFRDQALEAASRLRVSTAQGIALVYDFDYQAKPDWHRLI